MTSFHFFTSIEGLILMATAYIPAIYFYYDITFNQRKAETSILVGLFGEEGFRKLWNNLPENTPE